MSRREAAGLVLVVLGFSLFMAGGLLILWLGIEYGLASFVVSFALMIGGGMVIASAPAREGGPQLRIATPMAERGQATVRLTCPNCGATPDRIGVGLATCEYCGAPFLVPGA